MWKMEVTFNVNELEGMKRGELQKLCKSVGIKASSKVCAFQSSRSHRSFPGQGLYAKLCTKVRVYELLFVSCY